MPRLLDRQQGETNFGRHRLPGVALRPEQSCPVMRAGEVPFIRWAAQKQLVSTFTPYIAIIQHMKGQLLVRAKEVRDDGSIVEVVIWSLPEPLPPCRHLFKYRLYYGLAGQDRVRYDNERGKGDHRHVNGHELSYVFESVDKLLDDFERDIDEWSAT